MPLEDDWPLFLVQEGPMDLCSFRIVRPEYLSR